MDIQENYLKIKADIELLFEIELKKIDDRKPKVESGEKQKGVDMDGTEDESSRNGRAVSM